MLKRILLLMLASLTVGGYAVLKVNNFRYETKIKVLDLIEFETEIIKGIDQLHN